MAQSIKLSDEVMALVRREADLQSRSVAGQITHWLKIGRAIERSGTFDHARLGPGSGRRPRHYRIERRGRGRLA